MAMLKDSITIVIGGKSYDIPRMRFKQLKVAWANITEIGQLTRMQFPVGADGKIIDMSFEPIFMRWHTRKLELMLEVFVAAAKKTHPELTLDFIEENMEQHESRKLPDDFNALLAISGFEMGNAVVAQENTAPEPPTETQPSESSMATGTSSSQSSSPVESVEATGSELPIPSA